MWDRQDVHYGKEKNQHLKSKDNHAFHQALRKYGEENFEWIILEECDDTLLNEREIYWIKEKDTYNNGYNETRGGLCFPADGINSRKIRIYKVYNVDKKEFIKDCKSIYEALKFIKQNYQLELRSGDITAVCKGKVFSTKGFTFCYLDENDNCIPTNFQGDLDNGRKNLLKNAAAQSKGVQIFDKEHNLLNTFCSYSAAATYYGSKTSTISKYIDTNISPSKGNMKGLYFESYNGPVEKREIVRITQDIKQQVIELRKNNCSLIEIAKIVKISKSSVIRILKENDL